MKVSTVRRFYGYHARCYDFTRRLVLPSPAAVLGDLRVRKGDQILDLACGTGRNISELLKRDPSKIVGVDCTEAMLGRAQKKFRNVAFLLEDATAFQSKEKFDKVVCTFGLSMMDEWEAAVLRAKDALKSDGSFLAADFCALKGAAKPLGPLFEMWLRCHGIDCRRAYRPFLEKHFGQVEFHEARFGYYFVAVATSPK